WEVLLTMRKAAFGQSLIAGVVIVIFAILADRMSSALARDGKRHSWKVTAGILLAAVVIALFQNSALPAAQDFAAFKSAAAVIDRSLGAFIAANGVILDGVKNGTMFFVLLPLRIGLEKAVLP